MHFSDFLLFWIISFFILYTKTLVHEFGHILVLFATKRMLYFNGNLGLKVCILYGCGRTESYLYEHLSCMRENTKYKKYIKLNAISGIISELFFYIPLTLISLYKFFKNFSVISIIVFLSAICHFTLLFKNIWSSNDIKIFLKSENFDYLYDRDFKNFSIAKIQKSFSLKTNLLLFSFVSTFLTFIFSLFIV